VPTSPNTTTPTTSSLPNAVSSFFSGQPTIPQSHSRAESGQLTSLFILHNGFPERRKEIGKFLLDCPPGEVNDVFNGMYTNVFEPSLIGNDDGLKYFDHIN